jgi:DNA-binding Lrp family transcriptional regulator
MLDDIDVKILRTLQEDGRITNVDLAARVHLSPSACLRRVQNLEADGVIRSYTVLINEAALGHKLSIFVNITLERQTEDYLSAFENAVRGCPEIMDCYLMSGQADYLLRVVARDAEDYERLHKETLSRLPGVARIQTSIALRRVVRRQVAPPGLFDAPH